MAEAAENVQELHEASRQDASDEEHKKRIQMYMEMQKDKLVELMDSEFGLLDKLLKSRTLTNGEIQKIRSEKAMNEKNERLLEFIFNKNEQESLIQALTDTGQAHVVNFIKSNGERRNEFGLHWPLTLRESEILDNNQETLVDILETYELVNRLFSVGVINNRQKDSILAKLTGYERNEALLDIIRRLSLSGYGTTIQCLKALKQEHIAKILEFGGVSVQLHVNLSGENLDEIEKTLVNKLVDVIRNENLTQEGETRLIAALPLALIAAKRGNSIVLYVWCRTLDELQILCETVKKSELKDKLEQLFNILHPDSAILILMVTLLDTDVQTAKKSLEQTQKSFLPLVCREESKDTKTCGVAAAATAASLTQEEITTEIIRSNADFFSEQMYPETFINKLHSLGILSNHQTAKIATLKRLSEKNDELLSIVGSRSIQDYYRFVDCLRETGQTMVANVAEKGGLVLRVKAIHRKKDDLTNKEEEIVKTLNDILLPTSPKTDELHRFLGQLKKCNIEIVSAHRDRGIVLWFWCRSEKAVEHLEILHTNLLLTPLVNGLYRAVYRFLFPTADFDKIIPEICYMHMDELDADREFVSRRMSEFQLREKVELAERRSICGIAILHNRLCVLCRDPTTLLVYKEQSLTAPPEEILVEVAGSPVDMTCCNESNCLYITDSNEGAIYRVIFSQKGQKSELWPVSSSDPYTLSVTRDGHIVMVKRGSPPTLEEYDWDAQLLNKIALPSPITFPNHAVGTSSGNFVISHGSETAPGGIAVITKKGDVVNRFDFESEPIADLSEEIKLSELVELNLPSKFLSYLAIDEKDQIYGTDWQNGGVVFFDSELKLEKIIEKSSVAVPVRAQFLLENKLLFVVHGAAQNTVSILDAS